MDTIPGLDKLSVNEREEKPPEPPEPPETPTLSKLLNHDLLEDVKMLILTFLSKSDKNPCESVVNLCATSKTLFPLCSDYLFWKNLCKEMPDYVEPQEPNLPDDMEKLKYWKRHFSAWCLGKALVDSVHENNPKSIKNAVTEYFRIENKEFHSCGPIEEWYTEDVTDMAELFYLQTQGQKFNVCLNKWDFSNVKNANNMFRNCYTWNNGGVPINFNTKNVEFFVSTFEHCTSLNVPIEMITENCTAFFRMFFGCVKLNQKIEFETHNGKNFAEMFARCDKFNNGGSDGELRTMTWNTKAGKFFASMFRDCHSFNQRIRFDFSNAQTLSGMFSNCILFNNGATGASQSANYQLIVKPKHEAKFGIDMSHIFSGCISFNQKCDFDTSNVIKMNGMFFGCSKFNNGGVPLGFDTRNVEGFQSMFSGCKNFDQPCKEAGPNMGWQFDAVKAQEITSTAPGYLDLVYEHHPLHCMFESCPKITNEGWKLPGDINSKILFQRKRG